MTKMDAFLSTTTVACWCLSAVALSGAALAMAQAPREQPSTEGGNATVSWTVAPVAAAKRGRRIVLTVRGSIREGWHVYGLEQKATGPTPLVVAVERNDVALADGNAWGNAPTVAFEPAFGFATPFYARSVSLAVPVRLRPGLAPGRRLVPVSIRYQSCDGLVCLPPRTLHLTVPVDIRADS